mmetsp:Transcript_132492/g.233448  ORF Transcript_132492/g.233448 Transcript_132492/m.233448 type:complete len:247 (+) Transcript_132492:329-1069(+)
MCSSVVRGCATSLVRGEGSLCSATAAATSSQPPPPPCAALPGATGLGSSRPCNGEAPGLKGRSMLSIMLSSSLYAGSKPSCKTLVPDRSPKLDAGMPPVGEASGMSSGGPLDPTGLPSASAATGAAAATPTFFSATVGDLAGLEETAWLVEAAWKMAGAGRGRDLESVGLASESSWKRSFVVVTPSRGEGGADGLVCGMFPKLSPHDSSGSSGSAHSAACVTEGPGLSGAAALSGGSVSSTSNSAI